MKLIFCMQVNIKVSSKVILSLLMGLIKHSKSTQCNKFAISLQYLKKKEDRDRVNFLHADNIKVSTSWHYRFWWEWPVMYKVPMYENLVIFLQCFKKKNNDDCCNCFCVLLWCKPFRYFTGVQSCSLLHFSFWKMFI